MLSPDEDKAFDEIQRHYAERGEGRRPPRRRPTPTPFVVLWWISLFTVMAGATRPGLGMATAVVLGWLLWRYLPELGDILETASTGAPVSGRSTVAAEHSVMETARQPPRGERS